MNNSENTYKIMLEKSLYRITDEINLLEEQKDGLFSIVKQTEKKIERLRIEQAQLQRELAKRNAEDFSREEGIVEKIVDERVSKANQKENSYETKIQNLNKLKDNAKSNAGRRNIERKIVREQTKMFRYRKYVKLVTTVQRATIIPKYMLDKYRLGKFAKRQGNVNYYENKVAETEHKQSLLNPDESIVDKVQSVYYDKKGKYYAKRLDQANKKLEKLQRKGVQNRILGANVAVMNKKDTDKLRKRMDQHKDKKNEQNDSVIINPEKKQLPLVISQSQIPEDITAESLAEIAVNGESKTSLNQKTKSTKVA